jgi:hypothetical protein
LTPPFLFTELSARPGNLKIPISRANASQAEERKETEMSKIVDKSLPNTLRKVVDLLIESRIRIDAMEQLLVKRTQLPMSFTSA